jgi:hypothetical protein
MHITGTAADCCYMPPVKYSMAVEKAAKLAQPKHIALAPPAQHNTAQHSHNVELLRLCMPCWHNSAFIAAPML